MSVEQEPRIERAVDPGAQLPGRLPDEAYYRRGEQARRWGSVLVLVGVVWLVFALTARGSFFGFGFVEQRAPIPAQVFAAERVVIRGVSNQIELLPAAGDEITLEGVRHGFGWSADAAEGSLERLEVLVTEQGDTLTIEVRRPGFSGVGRSPYAELRLALPEGVQVQAELVSGDMSAREVRADLTLGTVSGMIETDNTVGAMTVRTTSGDVSLSDHNGALDVETVSGDVSADGALVSPLVETVSGDVELTGAQGPLELRSISGDLAVADAQDASLIIESTSGDVEFAGSLAQGASSRIGNISGDVQVELIRPADLRLELSTASGDLDSDLALRDEQRERRSLIGLIGDGETGLTISTTSGDVEVTEE